MTRQSLGNVLLIGAGTGNDVAVALAHGARHIDAVEIDPALPAISRQAAPRSTRTRTRGSPSHIADGPPFLQTPTQHYDLIMFTLPDSLTALAGQSGIRLESYLLTENSLAEARTAPGARRHVRHVQLVRPVRAEQVREQLY